MASEGCQIKILKRPNSAKEARKCQTDFCLRDADLSANVQSA